MTITYRLLMLLFTFFCAAFVFETSKMGYATLSTAGAIVFVLIIFGVEAYNHQMLKDSSGSGR